MHRVILSESVKLKEGATLAADVPYIIDSAMLASVANEADGNVRKAEAVEISRQDDQERFLLIRSGGAGDILFLTPALHALRLRFPKAQIDIACLGRFSWILDGNPDLTCVLPYPIPEAKLGEGTIITLENVIENNHEDHAVDIFGKLMGVPELPDRKTRYYPRPPRLAKTSGRKRIAVQFAASSAVRTYPHMAQVIVLLIKAGYEIVLFRDPGPFRLPESAKSRMIDPPTLGYTWRESMDLLPTCDAAIGPDSSMIHFAGALGVPTIAIYGSFDWRKRTLYQPSIRAIEATGPCAPCYHHGRRGHRLPPQCPSREARICQVLGSIEPERILKTVREMLQ